MENNTDLILEKLSTNKMGKQAFKTYRNGIDKVLSLIDVPAGSWNHIVHYDISSTFDLFKRDYLSPHVLVNVNFADMKADVRHDISSDMFVFGIKPSDFNFYSTARVSSDDIPRVRNSVKTPFKDIAYEWAFEKIDIAKQNHIKSFDDLDTSDQNYYAERFLEDYITEDMKKLIKNLYPTYFEFYYFMRHLTPYGTLMDSVLKDARVKADDVYKAISDAIYDFIFRRFIGVKIKDGYFKSVDTDNFIPICAVDFGRDVLYSNLCFRKIGLEAVKKKKDWPRYSYVLSAILKSGGFWVDYEGIEPDLLFSSDMKVTLKD